MNDIPLSPTDKPRTDWVLPSVLLVVVLSTSGFGLIAPLLPFYATALHAQAWQVAIVFAAYPAGQFVGEPFWGRLSDRIGPRVVLLCALSGLAAAYFAFALVSSLLAAITLRFVAGFMGGHLSTMQNVLISRGSPERVASRITAMSAATSFGVVLGPTIGGLCAGHGTSLESFRPPLMAGAALYAASAVLLFFALSSKTPARHAQGPDRKTLSASLRADVRRPAIWRCFVLNFLGYGAWAIVAATQGLFLHQQLGWGPRQLGLMLTIGAVGGGLFQAVFAGRLIERFSARKVLIVFMLLTAVELMAAPFLPRSLLIPACLVLSATTLGTPMSCVTSLLAAAAPAERRGGLLGINAAAGAFGRVGPAIIAGALFSWVGGYAPFLLAGAFLGAGALVGLGQGLAPAAVDG